MKWDLAKRGEEYYRSVGEKDIEKLKGLLDVDVEFFSPMAVLKGKEAVVQATGGFMNAIKSLTIRSRFASDTQAMIVYEIDVPEVVSNFPSASLLTFREGLIVKIELFFDSRKFIKS